MTPIPENREQITVEWLNATLPASLLNGSRVVGVESEPLGVGEGFAGALARLRLTTEPAIGLPPLVAKFASGHGTTRDLLVEMGGYEKEVRFYRAWAGRVDLPTPACYVAEYDPSAGAFILVFEDLAPATVGDQVAGATLEQAERVAEALAAFHARWWNDESLPKDRWLLPPDGFAERFLQLADEGMPALRDLWGDRYPELLALVARARKLMPGLLSRLGSGPPPKPYSLVHGDVRLDNMFFPNPEGGGRFAVIDWQGTAVGPPVNDLAYWMVLNLPVDLRRRHEDALLRRYHAGLIARGVKGFSFRSLRSAYRNGAVVLIAGAPVLAGNLDLSVERGQALMESAAERVDAAMRDFNAKRILQVLPWVLRGMDAWAAVKKPLGWVKRRRP